MEHQEMNLNIRYDAGDEVWNKIPYIYSQLDGWLGFGGAPNGGEQGIPYWYGFNEDEKHVCASVEPSGLFFTAFMNDDEWQLWKESIKSISTNVLGFKVGEIELGEVEE